MYMITITNFYSILALNSFIQYCINPTLGNDTLVCAKRAGTVILLMAKMVGMLKRDVELGRFHIILIHVEKIIFLSGS